MFIYISICNGTQHLGDSAGILKNLVVGNHAFNARLNAAKKPLIVLGSQQLRRKDGAAILALVQQLAQNVSVKSKVSNVFVFFFPLRLL